MIYIIIILILVILLARENLLRKKSEKEILGITNKLNTILNCEDYKTLLYNTDKKVLKSLLNSINDLMFRKIEEKTLRLEKEKTMNETLTNMSHDLRTPLTLIQGYVEYIGLNNRIDGDVKEIISIMDNKIIEVVHMINSFFSLAKLESGDEKITLEKINISKITRANLLNNYTALTKENIEVDVDISDEDIFISGNEDAFDRVLNNLITNSIKHGGENKYIKISIFNTTENVVVQVSDKGKGIEKENLEDIFKRGYTTKKAYKNGYKGSGLGLRITKILVESMNGETFVESEPFKLTVFSIKFPHLNEN
ncbi:MAG: sensor histidine kinase [Clostridium sp.]